MSAIPKRSHEETDHPSSKNPHQDSGTYSKLGSSLSSDHPIPNDAGQDSRVAKTPSAEARDTDKKSIHSVNQMPLSSDHPIGTQNKIESSDLKGNRDLQFENRDTEKKELHGESRGDSHTAKSEKDVCVEGQGNDNNKDIRYDRDNHNDTKNATKTEKYGSDLLSSPSNRKESKKHKGKRHFDSPSGRLDSGHTSRGNTPAEVGKKNSTAEERDYSEAGEAVEKNKIDSKSEDGFKDRERKDVKHRDWGDKEKERSDRRNSSQVNNSNRDSKESPNEDRGAEKLERERKYPPKEKENSKQREKAHTKRALWNEMEKEVSNNEKELGDGKTSEQETLLPDQKKQKVADSSKNVDGEGRESRKERDADIEGDQPDKHIKFDKKSEDGCADGEETEEKEREVHNYNVQRRKRIQRSRGSPQVANREARFASDAQDNEE